MLFINQKNQAEPGLKNKWYLMGLILFAITSEFLFINLAKSEVNKKKEALARIKKYYENDVVKLIENNYKRTAELLSQTSWQREPLAYLFSSLYQQNLELGKASYSTVIDRSKVFSTIYMPIKQTAKLLQQNDQKLITYLQKESPFRLSFLVTKSIPREDIENLDSLSIIGNDARALDIQEKLNFYPGSHSVYSYHVFMARLFAILNRLEYDLPDGKQDAQIMRSHIEKAQKILKHPYYEAVFKKLILDSLSSPGKLKDL